MWDPDWDEDDMAFALAWTEHEATLCGGCGRPLDETTREGHHQAYVGSLLVCHACAEGDRTLEALRKQEGAEMAGVRVRVVDRPGFEPPEVVTPDQ